ncbi:hypothetical protein SAMN04488508_108130 [Aquimarina spongiae]|uniref:Secreted protein n=2 Tax=Aquimarina spongiae TaxID=570521 RepID=A0A1M6IXY0_9FLAO|nr:hypothetical protein SAMN04488508_108130 [Aquimarina spongiae]
MSKFLFMKKSFLLLIVLQSFLFTNCSSSDADEEIFTSKEELILSNIQIGEPEELETYSEAVSSLEREEESAADVE